MNFLDASPTSALEISITAEVRPAVYWFWSEIPAADDSARQLEEIAAAGFSTVLIQTRLSFPREQYLSDAYLKAYRTAVEQAAGLELKVGVYDEYAWISGHAGGRTVAGADHLRERHLFWSTGTPDEAISATVSGVESWWIDGFGGPERKWLYDDGVRRWDEWELVAAVAHPPLNGGVTGDPQRGVLANLDVPVLEALDVTADTTISGNADSCTATTRAAVIPDGWVVTAFVSTRCASSRMVNYLDPRTAERFIEVAYEPYAHACEGLLGDPIIFFSFDHPYGGFYEWPEGKGSQVGNSLMWDREMTAITDELSGGQLARALLQIVHGRDRASRRLRTTFFASYSQRGIESFFAPLRRWADAHNVGLSGHELLAHLGSWGLNDAFPQVDSRTNFGLDYFGVDRHRSGTLVDASNFEAQISPCFGDSVARAHGRSRCIVEQYAARNDGPGHFAGGYWELTLEQLRLQTHRLHLLGCRQLLFHAYGQSDGTGANSDILTNPRFDFPPTCNFEPWFTHFCSYADESAALSAFIDGAEPVRKVALLYPLGTVWADGPGHVHAALVGEWAELLSRSGVGFDLVDDRALAAARTRGGEIEIHDHRYRAVIVAGASTLPSTRCIDALEEHAVQGGEVIITAPVTDLCTDADISSEELYARLAKIVAAPICAKVPDEVPVVLAALQGTVRIDAGSEPGTLWSWAGQDEHGFRVALLNDGPQMRVIRITTPDGAVGGLTLGSEEAVGVYLSAGRMGMFAPSRPAPGWPVSDEAATLNLDQGWMLDVGSGGRVPVRVDRGWEQQGFESFSGEGVYTFKFDAARLGADPTSEWVLELPEVHCVASVTLNGSDLGARGWRPFRFTIASGILQAQGNELTVTVANTAANRYYAGTPFQAGLQPSGLTAPPMIARVAGEDPPTERPGR